MSLPEPDLTAPVHATLARMPPAKGDGDAAPDDPGTLMNQPHLMSVEIAAERGETPLSPVCRPGQAAGTALADLADWLATSLGRVLEQEALDPVAPELR